MSNNANRYQPQSKRAIIYHYNQIWSEAVITEVKSKAVTRIRDYSNDDIQKLMIDEGNSYE